jgi:hypothetical protein
MGQPSHWTYCPFDQPDDLQQGDILRRSPALLAVLSEVLAYFCDERYTAFLIVTQTCDLVQRKPGYCKAEYINLCVVRELKPLLPTILEPCCGTGIPGVFASESRLYAEQMLRTVVNQNDQAHGLFYLHKDSDAGIDTPSVAMLRVSIALRREHYAMLQECRCGRLGPEYSAKLGWLTGNLYSRVATLDWEDQEKDPTASSKQAKLLLGQLSKHENENWVPQKWLTAAKAANEDLSTIPLERFRSTLARYAPPKTLDAVLDAVARVGRGVVMDTACDVTRKQLAEHGQFVREVAQQVVRSAVGMLSPQEQISLLESLEADVGFCEAIGNQVGNQLKQSARAVGEEVAKNMPNLLAATVGMLMPASRRLQMILSRLLGPGRADEVGRILESVAGTCIFSPAATQIAASVGQEAYPHFDVGMLEKMVSRLKNDQKLVAVCREQAIDPVPSSFLSD